MKINNIIKFAYYNISRNIRRTINYSLFLSISIFLLFIANSFAYSAYFTIYNNCNNDDNYKTLILQLKVNIKIDKNTIQELDRIKNIKEYNITKDAYGNNDQVNIVVNKFKYINKVYKLIMSLDKYRVLKNGQVLVEEGIINTFQNISAIMYIIVIVLSFIILNMVMVMSINERKMEIAILKTQGYNSKHLLSLIISESFILSNISYMISLIMSITIIKLIINPFIESRFQTDTHFTSLDINYITVIIVYLITIIISFADSMYVLNKTKKITLINQLK